MSAGVTLIQYGLGNIRAFANIFDRLNIPVSIADDVSGIEKAQRLILPGVGSFDWAMDRLNASGLRDALDRLVLDKKIPVFGVCVGLQMMGRRSEEGKSSGLGWIDGDVVRFNSVQPCNMPQPHMGWNDVTPTKTDPLFEGIHNPRYYFLHSYYIVPDQQNDVLATASYGHDFTAAVRKEHVCGTQFHPEKSHQWGIDLLANFAGS